MSIGDTPLFVMRALHASIDVSSNGDPCPPIHSARTSKGYVSAISCSSMAETEEGGRPKKAESLEKQATPPRRKDLGSFIMCSEIDTRAFGERACKQIMGRNGLVRDHGNQQKINL